MKVLYDHQIFSLQKFGGISKYFCELLKNFPAADTFILSVMLSNNHHLQEEATRIKKTIISLPNYNLPGENKLNRLIYFINKNYSKRLFSKGNYDLLHPTFYDNYFLELIKKPYVITVHDLTVYKYKESFMKRDPYRHLMERTIKNASRVIAISDNTKKDLCYYLNIKEENIDVVHHGFNRPSGRTKRNIKREYLLFVGRRSTYKNFSLFVKAISPLLTHNRNLTLVCVGSPFSKAEMSELLALNIYEQCKALTVNEEDLNSLYANAILFVYPSLYEGFGMPILEAFANNCPVVLSNSSCFPEIAGQAGIYFDPADKESILQAVSKTIYNTVYREQKIKLGQERLLNFSWKKTARETMQTYLKIANG